MARTAKAMEGPEKLREWRERHGFSRAALAEQLGFTDQTAVRVYELGQRHMTYTKLIALAELTGISAWTLANQKQRTEMVALAKSVPRRLVLMRGQQ